MGVFRAVLEMEVADVDAELFMVAWEHAATEFRQREGMIAQTLAADATDTGRFTITSDWEDERSFRAFETSTTQDDVTALMRSLRTSSSMKTQQIHKVILRGDE